MEKKVNVICSEWNTLYNKDESKREGDETVSIKLYYSLKTK